METALKLYETKGRRVLSSRETAREIAPTISGILGNDNSDGHLTVDMTNMSTVTPAFFDELLHVISESAAPASPVIDIENTTERQFARFKAVCRVHGLDTAPVGPNHWRITRG